MIKVNSPGNKKSTKLLKFYQENVQIKKEKQFKVDFI